MEKLHSTIVAAADKFIDSSASTGTFNHTLVMRDRPPVILFTVHRWRFWLLPLIIIADLLHPFVALATMCALVTFKRSRYFWKAMQYWVLRFTVNTRWPLEGVVLAESARDDSKELRTRIRRRPKSERKLLRDVHLAYARAVDGNLATYRNGVYRHIAGECGPGCSPTETSCSTLEETYERLLVQVMYLHWLSHCPDTQLLTSAKIALANV